MLEEITSDSGTEEKDISSFKDVRPVSVLHVLAKVMEMLMQLQIKRFTTDHDLLTDIQSRFRTGYIALPLLSLTDDILQATGVGSGYSIFRFLKGI